MDLPKLTPGKRFTLPRPTGLCRRHVAGTPGHPGEAAGKPMTVVTADASDAQRLLDEIAFFAPDLRCRTCSPTGKPCLTTPFRPTRI